MKDIISNMISEFFLSQTTDSSYYSEAAIQHKMGIEIFKQLRVEPVLEKKIPGQKEYLDIFFSYKKRNYGLELKYKTDSVDDSKFDYDYIKQGAQNNGKYDFISDIHRIESFIRKNLIDHGFAILITNDHLYWTPAKHGCAVKEFDITQNRVLHGEFNPNWNGRKTPLNIKGSYTVNWFQNMTQADKANFKGCIIEIN